MQEAISGPRPSKVAAIWKPRMEIDTAALLKLARERQKELKLVVVFPDSHYLEMLLNWLVPLNHLDIQNYLVVSLDPDIHAFLTERDFPSLMAPLRGSLRDLWEMRLRIFRTRCAAGIDFAHSGADAV